MAWQSFSQKALREKLMAVEEKIAATQEEIQRLSALTPEELAQREREQAVLSAQSATDDVEVLGVEVIKEGSKKIVKNTAQGYNLELPLNLLLARSISSDHLEFHDKELMCQGDPLCKPVILIETTEVNLRGLHLEKWLEEEEKKAGAEIYSPREEVIINGATFYKVTESLQPQFDGYYYYWSSGNKIYYLRISKFNEENYRAYLETLKLF